MSWGPLEAVAPEDRQRLLATARRRRFTRQEVVFHAGDPGDTLHLIAKGRVAVRVGTHLGDVVTLAVLGAGSTFGELALVGREQLRTATVVALEPVETLALRRGDVEQLRIRYPGIDRFLVELLANQVARLSDQVLEALYVPAEIRVLRRLHGLAEEYRDGLGPVVIPLPQQELASMAGTTRPTTNRVLREAEARGLIRLGRARIEVLDVDELARRSSGG